MSPRSRLYSTLFAIPALLVLATGMASAQEQPDGALLATTCLGCHGIEHYKNVYPTYYVPKLAGQNAQYISDALKGYRSGQRPHTTMHAQASSLSDAQMQAIAEYFAGQATLEPRDVPNPPESVQTVCVACHAASGVSALPMYPHLAGQHKDYLAESLRQYKLGERKNPIMAGIIMQLGDKLDDEMIDELATWYAKQPGLQTAD